MIPDGDRVQLLAYYARRCIDVTLDGTTAASRSDTSGHQYE